jgi:hypothetical protein
MFEGADQGGLVPSITRCRRPWWAKWVWAALIAPLLVIVLYGLARADVQADAKPITWTRCSGTISSGGTAQTISVGSGAALRGFFLENPSAATESLFFDPSAAASTTLSPELQAGMSVTFGPGTIFTGSMSVNAATGGHAFICLYGR